MYTNQLCVDLKAFNYAIKVFKVGMPRSNAKKKPVILPAILSFNNGFLSIECDEKVAVMNATGEWHGKAQFSSSVVQALALVPLNTNLVIINYIDGKLSIGATTASCNWTSVSKGMMELITNPSSIDVFAMWRTQPADALAAKGISQKNKLAMDLMFKATLSAAKKLEKFEVSADDLLG